ncbi:conserved Plasmodium protein, unknown function [Plasmodium relictum]|uniref:Uncharacterized protein n=1 Tax=Plasmodium relictum TaxID=85471 RepID=A0A1J1HCQ2_PLARL|nr:conserved Plasmodium protein, unknown function [Plasmodium relictum]CRH03079.1 conserved Plasmodium protein, unknown function [Plasmodium relictum]
MKYIIIFNFFLLYLYNRGKNNFEKIFFFPLILENEEITNLKYKILIGKKKGYSRILYGFFRKHRKKKGRNNSEKKRLRKQNKKKKKQRRKRRKEQRRKKREEKRRKKEEKKRRKEQKKKEREDKKRRKKEKKEREEEEQQKLDTQVKMTEREEEDEAENSEEKENAIPRERNKYNGYEVPQNRSIMENQTRYPQHEVSYTRNEPVNSFHTNNRNNIESQPSSFVNQNERNMNYSNSTYDNHIEQNEEVVINFNKLEHESKGEILKKIKNAIEILQ